MKKSRTLGARFNSCLRWPLMLLAPFLLVHAAYAGTWSQPVYTVSARTPVDPRPESAFWPHGGGQAVERTVIAGGGPDAGGTVFATFTYSPTGPTDKPSTTLTLIESASASWGVMRAMLGDRALRWHHAPSANLALFRPQNRPRVLLAQLQSGGSSAADGIGNPEVPTNPGPGGISQGFRVKTYPVVNGKVVTDAVGLSAHCDQSGPETMWFYSAQQLFFSPSPDNIALDDGSTKGLNQYVIDVGMPTSISWNGSNDALSLWLKNRVSWNLVGTAPALRSVDSIITSPSSVEPGHYPQVFPTPHPAPAPDETPAPAPAPVASPGFEFDVRTNASPSSTSNDGWKFPADNLEFGEKTLNHVVGGTTIPAPIALFFHSTGFQHPSGGPKGYYYGIFGTYAEVDTPNWFYYYNKAWTNPWGYDIQYWGNNYSRFDYDHPDTAINVGDDAYGLQGRSTSSGTPTLATELYGYRPGSNQIEYLGSETVRGLDTYVRTITHECVHKRFYILINTRLRGMRDRDADGGDQIPDEIEEQVGLDSSKKDTTGFSSEGDPYADYADAEVFCRMCEHGLLAPTKNGSADDWADDGINFGSPARPNRSARINTVLVVPYPQNHWGQTRQEQQDNYRNACSFPDALGSVHQYDDYFPPTL